MATQVAENSAKELREKLVKEMQGKIDETNKTRDGKGTRLFVGQTRGKNPQIVTWEAFDEGDSASLPATIAEFVELTKAPDEKALVSYLVEGFNAAQYTAASDPVAEFVEASWPEEVQKGFRATVRMYAANTGVSIEDSASLIKPGIVKVHGPK